MLNLGFADQADNAKPYFYAIFPLNYLQRAKMDVVLISKCNQIVMCV